MFVRNLLTVAIIAFVPASTAIASGGGSEPVPSRDWSFSGLSGTYDKAALQRGYKIYREVCSSCHSMKRIYFRNLSDLGYNEAQIKNIAAEYTVEDGPNDEGDMFERNGLPSDALPSPFPNVQAAKFANGGAFPPDLSLIIKARGNGANYTSALLTGYKDTPPHGEELSDGQYWNTYFPGHKLAMAPPLSEGQISYEDGSLETLEQYSHDVVQFLTWASDPYMEERKSTGFKVIIFLIIFAGIMLAVKRKVWADLH